MNVREPILVAPLFPKLHTTLIALLSSLSAEEWHRPTVCSEWSVKDIASHLLDGAVRRLSAHRDGYFPASAPASFSSHQELVAYLHSLNRSWAQATQRLSPRVLLTLLDSTGKELSDLMQQLDPTTPALFPVAWAGESSSECWFDIAREYTERWHHHQQIADAVAKDSGIFTRELYHPVLETFSRALPHTFASIHAPQDTKVTLYVIGAAGGKWSIVRQKDSWNPCDDHSEPNACVSMPREIAWKVFTKRRDRAAVLQCYPEIRIDGDHELGGRVLEMVSIMA